MLKINEFIYTNLDQRLTDPNTDFQVEFKLRPCHHMNFHDAADYTVKLLASQYKKIYLSLSGGADSEYMVRAFHRNAVDFEVIIVNTKLNNNELVYGLKTCKELDIVPIVLNFNEKQYFNVYYHDIFKTLNGIGVHSTSPFIAAQYASINNGILLIGDHHMDDSQNTSGIGMLEIGEWEFYNHVLIPNSTICFFSHTLELLRSLASYDLVNFDSFKCKYVYNVEERPKSGYKFANENLNQIYQYITYQSKPSHYCYPLSKRQFLNAT